MFEDILGKARTKNPETKDTIIEALKDNLDKKEVIIDELLERITELEREIEGIRGDIGYG